MKHGEVIIDPDRLVIAVTDILDHLRRENEKPDVHLLQVVETGIAESRMRCTPRGAFILRDALPADEQGRIAIGEGPFFTGRTIVKRMKGARSYAFFLVTIGSGPEEWARSLIKEGQYLEGYVADLVASALTEAAAGLVHEAIRKTGEERAYSCTNRYSPGYCGWDVAEQQKLFALFPEDTCGIRLTPSSLMSPIKSVSGVIGLGPAVTFEEYSCELCSMKDCRYRRPRSLKP